MAIYLSESNRPIIKINTYKYVFVIIIKIKVQDIYKHNKHTNDTHILSNISSKTHWFFPTCPTCHVDYYNDFFPHVALTFPMYSIDSSQYVHSTCGIDYSPQVILTIPYMWHWLFPTSNIDYFPHVSLTNYHMLHWLFHAC